MSDDLIVTRANSVMEIRFSRPEKKNALTRAMYDGVVAAFEAAEGDPEIRVIMLTGTGDTFTSGNDIKISSSAPPVRTRPPRRPF